MGFLLIGRLRFRSAVVLGCILAPLAGLCADFRTTAFNALLKINEDRTIVVDETIQIVPGDQPIGSLVLAEAPKGARKTSFLVSRASTTVNGATSDLKTTSTDDSLTANISADANKSPIQIHVNYSVLGCFTDRAGGTLGSRSTLSWNLVPANWPSTVESSTLEVHYPEGKIPVYVGADMGTGGSRSQIVKTQSTAFTGKVDAFNVSEGKDGITLQPPSGIASDAGMHLLISFSKKDLTAAPAKLTATSAAPNTKPKGNRPTRFKSSSAPRPEQTSQKPTHNEQGPWPAILPLIPTVVFFFLYVKRFPFLRGHALPTSAVPEGIGPAEAGYLLEGTLRPRHVLGALTAVAEGGFSRPDRATVDPASLGPVERRALDILKRRPNIGNAEEAKSYLSGSLGELKGLVVQSLASQNYLFPSAKRSKAVPLITLLIALAIMAYVAISANILVGSISTGIAALFGAYLLFVLSPLTQKGALAHRKLRGLHRFLAAHTKELEANDTLVEAFRPYAVGFGIVKE